jgi:hypothetical protein
VAIEGCHQLGRDWDLAHMMPPPLQGAERDDATLDLNR